MARKLTAKIKIEADTKAAKKGFDQLDNSIDRTEGHIDGLNDVLDETVDALAKTAKQAKKTEDATSKLGGSVTKLGKFLGDNFKKAATAAAVAVAAIAAATVKALLSAESYTNALNLQRGALSGLGADADRASASLAKHALALERSTGATEEEILQVQALIGSFATSEEQIRSLTVATLDFAAATARGPKEAAEQVAKSFGTASNALGEYNIELTAVIGSEERAVEITDQLAASFGGLAAAASEGPLEGLGTEVNNLLERFGLLIAETDLYRGSLARLTEEAKENTDAMEEDEGAFAAFFTTLKKTLLPGFIQDMIEATQEVGKQTIAEEKLAQARRDSTKELDKEREAMDKLAAEAAVLITSLEKLGILIPDNTQALKDNDEQLRIVTAGFDLGRVSLDDYLDAVERNRIANLDLFESHLKVADSLTNQAIPATNQAIEAINLETIATERLIGVKQREIEVTQQQTSATEQAAAARRAGSTNDVQGGTFTIPEGFTIGPNGRIIRIGQTFVGGPF